VAEKLTKRTVDRLIAAADPGRDKLVWDAAVPGLVLRLRSDSLRTTFSSIAADAGYSEIIVAALLGHRVAAGVTARATSIPTVTLCATRLT
jgi:integrase